MLGLLGIAPDLIHTAQPNFSMPTLMYSESRVGKSHPLIDYSQADVHAPGTEELITDPAAS